MFDDRGAFFCSAREAFFCWKKHFISQELLKKLSVLHICCNCRSLGRAFVNFRSDYCSCLLLEKYAVCRGRAVAVLCKLIDGDRSQ